MNPLARFLTHKDSHRLAYRLLVYIVLCSSFFALLSSSVQLYLAYKKDLMPVESNIQFIRDNYIQDISASLYTADGKQLKILLLAALQLEDIEYLDVRKIETGKEFIAFEGNPNVRKGLVREFPLSYQVLSGEPHPLGTLTVVASSEGAFQRLWERGIVLLISNSIKTFFASFCILTIFQVVVTRHLDKLACFSRSLSLDKLGHPLVLNRRHSKPGKADELDQVVVAFNDMLNRISSDVTAIKKVEQELRHSEQRYRMLVETMNDSLAVVDENGSLTYVNEKCCQMLVYEKDELIGRSLIDFLDKNSISVFEEQFALRRKGEQRGFYEATFVRKSGEKVYAIVSATLLHDSNDHFKGSFGVITDITTRKQMELELKNAFSEIKQLKDRLEVENVYLREQIEVKYTHEGIVGQSEALNGVLSQAEQVAGTNSTVLLLGETGTGKELIARTIHNLSLRKNRTMVKVNCAALPPTLIESELFGREKGAYTGALSKQIGRFEIADGSTLFLDEIGELPLELQSKLLRVLQDGQFERIGSSKTLHVDVRVIAATNRDLVKAVRKGHYREDLYYRLNVFPIFIPPLRQRSEDIPLLVKAFVNEFGKKMGKRITTVPQKTMTGMLSYPWPGNVRELKNVIEHGMIISKGETLNIQLPGISDVGTSPHHSLDDVVREHILHVLENTGWKIKGKDGAAEILGLVPSTLMSKMKKLRIIRSNV